MSQEVFRQRLSELIADTPKDLIADTYAQTLANIVDKAAFDAVFGDLISPGGYKRAGRNEDGTINFERIEPE